MKTRILLDNILRLIPISKKLFQNKAKPNKVNIPEYIAEVKRVETKFRRLKNDFNE